MPDTFDGFSSRFTYLHDIHTCVSNIVIYGHLDTFPPQLLCECVRCSGVAIRNSLIIWRPCRPFLESINPCLFSPRGVLSQNIFFQLGLDNLVLYVNFKTMEIELILLSLVGVVRSTIRFILVLELAGSTKEGTASNQVYFF